MASNKKHGLNRGLDYLFSDNAVNENAVTELRITEIEPNREQPRRQFDEAALAELAESIRQYGLLQPITVRPMANLGYQIVAGERRWRASRMAGLETVPVIIRETDDRECAEIAMIENLQREDLNPVEEARGYRSLMDRFSMTQDQVAQAVGKSRPAVANTLRLLALPEEMLGLLEKGEITSGHARALLAIEDPQLRDVALNMARGGATVRELEKLAKSKRRASSAESNPTLPFYKEVELSLTQSLGRKVKITGSNGKGCLSVEFYSDDELCDMAQRLGRE